MSATVPPVREVRTVMYRVLKRDDSTVESVTRWIEQNPLAITNEYPYPSATKVGEAFGEGDYLIFEADENGYQRVTLLSVVADRIYREKTDES